MSCSIQSSYLSAISEKDNGGNTMHIIGRCYGVGTGRIAGVGAGGADGAGADGAGAGDIGCGDTISGSTGVVKYAWTFPMGS